MTFKILGKNIMLLLTRSQFSIRRIIFFYLGSLICHFVLIGIGMGQAQILYSSILRLRKRKVSFTTFLSRLWTTRPSPSKREFFPRTLDGWRTLSLKTLSSANQKTETDSTRFLEALSCAKHSSWPLPMRMSTRSKDPLSCTWMTLSSSYLLMLDRCFILIHR